MTSASKLLLLSFLTIFAITGVMLLEPTPQNPTYHLFADTRAIAAIPNFWNVITNVPFVIIGIYGLSLLKEKNKQRSFRVIYAVIFSGILLTGFGSAYYHYDPTNNSLVFDRIPMTIVFMSFLVATIAEYISARMGQLLLFPLTLLGVASVLWWHYSGDLRFYGFIQFYPLIFIPLILILYRPANRIWHALSWVIVWYVIAKIFEYLDKDIYFITGFISGHSLKHLAAAMATLIIVRLFAKK